MSESFQDATRVERLEDGVFAIEVPPGWEQGRGAFGGVGIGAAARAIEALEPERPVRALTAEIPGPLAPGAARIETRVLRRGSGMTSIDALVRQGDEVRLRVSAVLGAARDVDVPAFAPEPPAMGDWGEAEVLAALPPPFARHFEYRPTGPYPFMGGAEPVAAGWIRPRVPLERWSAPEIAALADCYWPALFATLRAPRPMATVAYGLHLTDHAQTLPTDAPLFYRSRAVAGSGGYVAEQRELWTADGRLVALNPQTFAIIA